MFVILKQVVRQSLEQLRGCIFLYYYLFYE